jgi:hypothetical protein
MMVPKPKPSPSKPRKRIPRSQNPIQKVNPRRKAKRDARYRKMLSGKEYRSARAEALVRAGNRCEYQFDVSVYLDRVNAFIRCDVTEELHAHHLRYPKTRPLRASDLKILCRPHHEQAEAAKMHKTRMF